MLDKWTLGFCSAQLEPPQLDRYQRLAEPGQVFERLPRVFFARPGRAGLSTVTDIPLRASSSPLKPRVEAS